MKGSRFLNETPIDELYDWFADVAAATSPTWERLCHWISQTPSINRLLDALPGPARQPNRLLAAVRFLDGPTEPGGEFEAWFHKNWDTIERTITTKTTQTNEPGRCAMFAPVLASLPQPIALLELGASAGLCLIPDRYRYRYNEKTATPITASANAPEFPCQVEGTPPASPTRLKIAARLGLDLNPLDVTDTDTQRWLRALVWPDEEDREARLAAALQVASKAPPMIRKADLNCDPTKHLSEAIADLAPQAPGATPVILHSAFLAYLPREDRQAVADAIQASGAHWLSFEGPRVIPSIDTSVLGEMPPNSSFTVSLDGRPLGWAQAHGRWVAWRNNHTTDKEGY